VPAIETKINLLPVDPFEQGFWGRFLKWGLSVGRYIVIATELVVILAFLSRFKLDRDLSDLNESIAEKQAVLAAYSTLEADYRELAGRLGLIKQLRLTGLSSPEEIGSLEQLTPADVSFGMIRMTGTELELAGRAGSETGLAAFLRALTNKGGFKTVTVGQISSGEGSSGIEFRLIATKKGK
jgi:Tfp pilus assembly protein PilN